MAINLNPDRYPDPDAPRSYDVPVPAQTKPYEVGTPEWWLQRLLLKVQRQQAYCRPKWAFYEGHQPLAFASKKFHEAFDERYEALPANFMPLVVDAERERLIVQGFRVGKKTNDAAVWGLWQANNLDAESQIAHEITLAKGSAYTMVTPQRGAPPMITIEDPEQVALETQPGNRRVRLAAVKVWRADDGYHYASLILPGWIYKYRTRNATASEYAGQSWTNPEIWVPAPLEGEDWPLRNELGEVTVVPLLNRPTRDGQGRSEIVPVVGNQNAINFLRFSALVGSDVAALPQRWAKNLDLEVDPDTGQPKIPFRPGVQNLWATRRPTSEESAEYGDKYPETEFGQFPAADLAPFVKLIQEEVSQMASISRTPYHYLLGAPQSVPPTGESIKSSEAPLVKKVIAEAVHLGEGWEETMRLALIAADQRGKARQDSETIWADPETRNEAARTDSIMKQFEQGLLTQEVALEELGYSPQVIERIIKAQAAAPPPEVPPVEVPVEQ